MRKKLNSSHTSWQLHNIIGTDCWADLQTMHQFITEAGLKVSTRALQNTLVRMVHSGRATSTISLDDTTVLYRVLGQA